MTAKIIKGLPIANALRDELIPKIEALKAKGVNPKLAVILAGGNEASRVYAQSKSKVAEKLGIEYQLYEKPDSVTNEELLKLIDELNADPKVHGILVELPLPKGISKELIMNRLDPKKDADGVNPVNRGYLLGGQEQLAIVPATPKSCIELIVRSGYVLKGAKVALLGRGDTVGRPLASLLLNRDATVTLCHTKTKDVPAVTKNAEIIVAAAGALHFVKAEWLTAGQVVIDVGINALPDGSGISGDVDPKAAEVVEAISPVPGGVGSLTTTIIMDNLLQAIKLQGLG
ncbi:MAG: bifunctional 5,10-methylenetetrahydrofolate dehydrogenase/5,10-methenyltetrahydrofolate cyclohydrolase [Deltaproteobacteria bacterium]|jgi:methylenetetrahydrofolate dehydrogenase (NADP+)/methenyltetrahydrofolate cyclohydrolase|nr:bifunctional 5,10-methylenetetrahydrofolate dehydrogenase/5,10-methenyltetrahydrofolate cyclohydrolase [Deltaproteobacteria bacterium]